MLTSNMRLVKPASTMPASQLRQVALDALDSDTFRKAWESYNKLAGAKNLPQVASIEEIREAIMNQVTFYRSSGGQAAIWSKAMPGRFNDIISKNPTEYWMQLSDEAYYAVSAERAAAHELLHLGAMLKGQQGGMLWGTIHEVGVTRVTTLDTLFDTGIGVGILGFGASRAMQALMAREEE